MKRIFTAMMALALATTVIFTGCAAEKTPEEIEQERLESIAQEEESTGLKRLDSPNFTDYELPLQQLIQGIKENNAEKICEAVGSPCVLADEDIYGWVLQSGLDFVQQEELADLRIRSTKENAMASITLYASTEDPQNKDAGQVFTSVYENGKWILTPEAGVEENYTFTAPSRDVSCGEASLRDYAVSVDSNGIWTFKIPHMIVTDSMKNFKLSTQLGEFNAMMINSSNGYLSASELIVDMDEDQKTEYTAIVQTAFQKVFDLLKTGADQNQLSEVLVSEKLISGCFPQSEEEKASLAANLATVTGVEVYPGNPSNQYPDAYVYRAYKDNGLQMDVKLKIVTTAGESRKLATVTMQYLNNEWKIANVECKNQLNPFTNFSVFDPEW